MGRRTIRNEKGSMSDQPRVTLHGGPKIADGMTLPLPRLVQGIYVYGTLYCPPAPPAPYYPDWYAEEDAD
jgi:hypothetical protein